jgi:phage terminase large subunit-like protein
MVRKKQATQEISLSQLLAQAASDLETTSVRPNMYTYRPHEKQCIFHGSVLREKLFIGGNRSGKTMANVMECVWWLTKTHPNRPDVNAIVEPIRGRYVSVSFKEGIEKIALPYFKQLIPASKLINGNWDASYNNYLKTLTLADGSFIEFMSYDQELENFAGTSRHFVSYDEEPPQAIFIECRMRLIDTKGSWWISMTPVEGMSWIFDIIYEPAMDGNRPQTLIIEIRTVENPNVEAEEIDAALEGLTDDDKAARKEGRFIELGGKVYPSFSPLLHKAPEFILNPTMTVYTSYDHGWRHPAAWLWHAVEPNGHVTTFHEIIVSMKTVDELAQEVLEYEKNFLSPKGMRVYMRPADPACGQTSGINGMSILQLYALKGIYLATDTIPKGPGSVAVGLDKVQQYLKRDPDPAEYGRPFWQYHDCPILEKQMGRLRWDKYTSKKLEYDNAPRDTIHKKDDDGPDSMRYFFTLMPDLYMPDTKIVKKPITTAGGLSAVPNATPWNSYAGARHEMLPDTRGDYTVYEGSDLYALEEL